MFYSTDLVNITEIRDLPTKCCTGNFPVWAVKSKDSWIREWSFALLQPFTTLFHFILSRHIKQLLKIYTFTNFHHIQTVKDIIPCRKSNLMGIDAERLNQKKTFMTDR